MEWLRSRLRLCTPATLLVFLAAMAAPRAAFVVHRHAGGDHGHHHLDARSTATGDAETDRLLAEALGERPRHSHRHPPAAGAALESRAAADATAHWHVQSPFHHAVAAEVPALAALHRIALSATESLLAAPSGRIAPTRARAPPHPTVRS